MGILRIEAMSIGQSGLTPSIIKIDTNDTLATVLGTGYLNKAVQMGELFSESDMALVSTKTTPSAAATSVGWLEVSKSGSDWSLIATSAPGTVVLPTVANQLAHATDANGTMSTAAAAAVTHLGSIYAGASGTSGSVRSYSSTASKGYLELLGVANTGDTAVSISNAAHGQATVVSIPDGGQATSEFIIADSAGTQNITSGALSVDAGLISSGLAAGGFAGKLTAFSNTAAKGSISLLSTDSTGDFDLILTNADILQDQTLTIPNVGTTGSLLTSSLVASEAGSNLIAVDVTVTQAELATGGTKILKASSGTDQYKVRNIFLNSGGTNYSGGGGDRLGEITDGTTSYSVIPAATMQSLVNATWGSTEVAFPASAAINTSTAAAADIVFQYSGGATDYTAGSLVVSLILEKVA